MKCIQLDRDLWRIYLTNAHSRSKILLEGFDFKNQHILPYDTNPYSAGLEGPRDQALKVTICGVPLSVDDSAIHEMLIKLGVSNSPHSRGVTILFKKEFSFKFIYQHRSNDGRIILLNIEHDNKNITLINIYAPNTENLRSDFSKRFLNGYRNIV